MVNRIGTHRCLDCDHITNAHKCPLCGGQMVQYKPECPVCKKLGIITEVWGKNLLRVKKYPHYGRCKVCQYRNHLMFRWRRLDKKQRGLLK